MKDMNLEPKRTSRDPHIFRLRRGGREVRIEQDGNVSGFGLQLVQDLQFLRPKGVQKEGNARNVSARTVEACYKSDPDRIGAGREDNWDFGRGRLGCESRFRATTREDHRHSTAHQIARQFWQPFKATFGPSVLHRHVAGFTKALAERGCHRGVRIWYGAVKEPDHRHRCLLRTRTQRPRHRRAAKQPEEFSATHGPAPSSSKR
jgi:hypothetical protein